MDTKKVLHQLNLLSNRLGPDTSGDEWYDEIAMFLEAYGVDVIPLEDEGDMFDDVNDMMSLYKKISDR